MKPQKAGLGTALLETAESKVIELKALSHHIDIHMDDIFPLGTGIGRVRGVVNILKQHKGRAELSELADESEEDIDDLLPVIEACKMLGFLTINDSEARLTEAGSKLTLSNFSKSVHSSLSSIEPFKTSLKIINEGNITTEELFSKLKERGIRLHGEDTTNDILLKKMLIRWGVRGGLMKYDPETDSWSKAPGF